MAKKGSLELSVNSIVILVLAITMLGLGLSFIRGMFSKGTGRIGQILETTELEAKPTADNTVTIQDPLEVAIGEEKTLEVGFYNANRWGSGTAATATIEITQCQKGKDEFATAPVIFAPSQDVAPSQIGAYKAIFDTSNARVTDGAESMEAGTFICTLEINNGAIDSAKKVYDSRQFFLRVTS